MSSAKPLKTNVYRGSYTFYYFGSIADRIGITDISPSESHRYWSLMSILFAIASVALGWAREENKGEIFRELIYRGDCYDRNPAGN